MTDIRPLMTIGDFARGAGLSPKALRLYDELGLLVPVEVDQFSGYRRYATSQLERARLVATHRLLGMPLARIKQIVDLSPAAASRQVEAYWRQVEADTATRRGIVTTLVRQLRNEVDRMTTTTEPLRTEFGTSHRQGQRDLRALVPGVAADEISVDLHPGDRLVLITDGVHSYVDHLTPLLTTTAAAQEVADAVAMAVADAGEPDNHTIVVADLA